MRSRKILGLMAIVALASVPLYGGLAKAAPTTTIILGDNFFSPSAKTVSSGTKVRFKWTGNRRHRVTKAKGPGGDFASEKTKVDGVNLVKTFNASGTYRIICSVHPSEMRLKITVP
ncbi:MAG TPA: plastocyanin/azurin family copper-binding protein [Solirubrobacterales bacterium]